MMKGKLTFRSFLYPCFFLISFMLSAGSVCAETLSLPEGLRIATEKSRIVRMSLMDESMSEADTFIARSALLPQVSISGSHTSLSHKPTALFGDMAVAVPVSEKDYYATSLKIQQVVFDFMGNASRYKASKLLLKTKQLDTVRYRNLVALEFALHYFNLLESDSFIRVAEKEVARLESHLRDAQSLYDEGVITKNDLLQAKVRISDARQRLLSVRNSRNITVARINSSLRRPLTNDIQPVDSVSAQLIVLDPSLETAWATALKQRAEIQMLDETSQALDLQETAKRAEFLPKFFIQGGFDYTQNRYQLYEDNWYITFGVTLDLFSGGRTRAELQKIETQREKLLEEKEKIIDDIKLEVEQYILDMKTARERIAVTEHAVQQAEENLRINKLKYEEGVGTATDVLDAVALMTLSETNYSKAVYDLRKAEAAVLYALGTDLMEVYK